MKHIRKSELIKLLETIDGDPFIVVGDPDSRIKYIAPITEIVFSRFDNELDNKQYIANVPVTLYFHKG